MITILLSSLLLLSLSPVACIAAAEDTRHPFKARVTSLSPKFGSEAGGTALQVRGSGFLRDGFIGRVEVYIGPFKCPIDDSRSTNTKIYCTTPKQPYLTERLYPVKVLLLGVDGSEFASGEVSFYYSDVYTPYFNSISSSVTSGGTLHVGGYLRGTSTSDFNLKFDGLLCSVTGDLPSSSNDFSEVKCDMPDLEAGRYPLDAVLRDRKYGFALLAADIVQVSPADGSVFHVEVYPEVASMSTSSSGSLGGQDLRITGTGFSENCSKLEVIVAGQECEPLSCSIFEIVCRVPPAPQTALERPYASPRGLLVKSWPVDEPLNITTTVQSNGFTNIELPADISYEQQMSGFFIAPETADYTFYIRGVISAQLFLSTDFSAANKVLVARTDSPALRYYDHYNTQASAKISLQAGEQYYIEATHTSGYLNELQVAMQIHRPAQTEAERMYRTVKEQIEIHLDTPLIREVQAFQFSGVTGGSYKLNGENGLSSDIVFNLDSDGSALAAAAREVTSLCLCHGCTEIESLGRTVAGDGTVTILLKFNCPRELPHPLLQIVNTQLLTDSGFSLDVQRLQTASAPIRGFFRLNYNGTFTKDLPVDTNWFDIRESLREIGVETTVYNHITTGHVLDGADWGLRFKESQDNVPTLAIDGSKLTGGTARIVTIEASSQNMFYDPIPGHMLRQEEKDRPAVQVLVNGITASCAEEGNECGFEHQSELTPLINFSSVSGIVKYGDVLEFTGFQLDNATVRLGDADCAIISESDSHVRCQLGDGIAGTFDVEVSTEIGGIAASAPSLTYLLEVNGFSPSSGGVMGGTTITFTGRGMSSDMAILVGGRTCEVSECSAASCTCQVPPMASAASSAFGSGTQVTQVSVDGNILSQTFSYDWSVTPEISSFEPTIASTAVSTPMVLTGTFPTNGHSSCDPVITFGDSICGQVSVTASEVRCILFRSETASVGTFKPVASFCKSRTLTNAHTAVSAELDLSFGVASVAPSSGGVKGGNLITIQGTGFADRPEVVRVIAEYDHEIIECAVKEANFTLISCEMGGFPEDSERIEQDNHGTIRVYVNGHPARCSSCPYSVLPSQTTILSDTTPKAALKGQTFQILGSNFLDGMTVSFGNFTLGVTSVTATSASVEMPELPGGVYKVTGSSNFGIAKSDLYFTSSLDIAGISPRIGSKAGGTVVTITGYGFGTSADQVKVFFGPYRAQVTSSTYNQIVCTSPAYFPDPHGNEPTTNDISVLVTGPNTDSTDLVSPCTAGCAFNYIVQSTPAISGTYDIENVTKGDVISILGIHFGTKPEEVDIQLGGSPCELYTPTFSDFFLECTVGDMAAGVHQIYITTPNGTAKHVKRFRANLEVNSVYPSAGSFAGNTVVTLAGHGFASTAEGMLVDVCGVPCEVLSSEYGQVTCKTAQINTLEAYQAFNHLDSESLSGTWSTNGYQGLTANLNDNDYSTFFSYANDSCFVELDLGRFQALVTQIRVFPQLTNKEGVLGGVFEGSSNGTDYFVLANVDSLTDGWTELAVNASEPVSFIRFRGAAGGNCEVTELDIVGIPFSRTVDGDCQINVAVLPVRNHPSQGEYSVEPIVDNAAATLTADATFTPTGAQTGFVSSMSPTRGSALGGTLVTLGGVRLSNVDSVILNGEVCNIQSTSATEVTCVTTPRTKRVLPSLEVSEPLTNILLDPSLKFRYLDRWSATTTWRYQEMPVEGDTVIVPADQAILMDVSPPRLFLLQVEGMLVFEDSQDLTLEASYILVKGGVMEVGTEGVPFQHKATITLYGNRSSTEVPLLGSKFLAVTGPSFPIREQDLRHIHSEENMGHLDIHGTPRLKQWLYLDAPAFKGETTLLLSAEVDLQPGDNLVITSTHPNLDYTTQELTVVSLEPDGRTVSVTPGLSFDHVNDFYELNGTMVDLRSAVAVLDRNIIIQGDIEDSSDEAFGVQLVATAATRSRIENVEIRQCGQLSGVDRHCVQFRRAGYQQGSYIKNSAIHHSYQRAISVTDTDRAEFRGNVAYHIRGHAYYCGHGDESYNVFAENFGARIFKTYGMLISDITPAVFYTSSPNNFWLDNLAANSDGDGFRFELDGISSTGVHCPSGDRLAGFARNKAFNNLRNGILISPDYIPQRFPCDTDVTHPVYFHSTTVFRNAAHGIDVVGGHLHFVDSVLVGNLEDDFYWSKLHPHTFTPFDTREDMEANVVNALIVGNTTEDVDKDKRGLYTPASESFFVSGVNFHNLIGAIAGCPQCTNEQGGFTVHFRNLSFTNCTNRTKWTDPYKQIFIDLDGSLTGVVKGSVAPYWKFNDFDDCSVVTELDGGLVCSAASPYRRLQVYDVEPGSLIGKKIQLSGSGAGTASVKFAESEYLGWAIPVASRHKYTVKFSALSDFTYMGLRYAEIYYMTEGEWTQLTWKYTDYRSGFEVHYVADPDRVVPAISTVSSLKATDAFGTGRIIQQQKKWQVMLAPNNIQVDTTAEKGALSLAVKPLLCDPGTCDQPDSVPLGTPVLWSSNSSWPMNRPPIEGEDVEIPAGVYMVLDVSTATLGHLDIQGKLEFQDNADIELNCSTIAVFGTLQIGTSSRPFTHKAVVRLFGKRNSDILIVKERLFLGNKVMAVFGEVNMFGSSGGCPSSAFPLAETAHPGNTSVWLHENPGWQPGDMIVLSVTEAGGAKTVETRNITNVTDGGLHIHFEDEPLKYEHLVRTVDDGLDGILLEAVVSKINRNIVFESHLTSTKDKYGATIHVTQLPDSNPVRIGRLNVRGVEFAKIGKSDMEYPGIQISYPTSVLPAHGVVNSIQCSSFTDNFHTSIELTGAHGTVLNKNVFAKNTAGYGIYSGPTSVGTDIQGNLAVGLGGNGMKVTHAFYASIYTANPYFTLKDNIVSGTSGAAYMFHAQECNRTSVLVADNEAHGTTLGAFLLTAAERNDCLIFDQFKAWRIGTTAVLTADQTANMVISDTVIVESRVGISLNFYRQHNHSNWASIKDSTIAGFSAEDGDCSEAFQCSGSNCGTTVGGFRHVGILSPQYNNKPKTCGLALSPEQCFDNSAILVGCAQPYEASYGNPGTFDAILNLTNNHFVNFRLNDCSNKESVAYFVNPTQVSFSPQVKVEQLTWYNASLDARLWIAQNTSSPAACDNGCDALSFATVTDVDGSLYDYSFSDALYLSKEAPGLASNDSECVPVPEFGALRCKSLRLVHGSFENLDRDAYARKLGPIQISRDDQTTLTHGSQDDGCGPSGPDGRFQMAWRPGRTHDIVPTSTMPGNVRLRFFSEDPSDSVLLRLYYPNPVELHVFAEDELVPSSNFTPTVNSGNGANYFDAAAKTLYLVLGGGVLNDFGITVRVDNKIVLQMKLKMNPQDFFGERLVESLATLLGIPPSTIKFVSVESQSLARRDTDGEPSVATLTTTLEISDPENTTPKSDEDSSAQLERLDRVLEDLKRVARGSLQSELAEMGAVVTELDVALPAGTGAEASVSLTESLNTDGSTSKSFDATWVAFGLGLAVIMALVATIVLVMKWRQQHGVTSKAEPDLPLPTYAPSCPSCIASARASMAAGMPMQSPEDHLQMLYKGLANQFQRSSSGQPSSFSQPPLTQSPLATSRNSTQQATLRQPRRSRISPAKRNEIEI